MRRYDVLSPASALLAAFALVGASACERGSINSDEEQSAEISGKQGTDTEDQEAVGIEEIQEETAQVMGEEVVVAGEIDDLRSSRAFVLESDGFLGIFDDEILILTRSPIQLSGGQELSEDSDVRVRGKVQKLVVADVETELGWDLDQQLEIEYRGQPIIIADAIWLMEQRGQWLEGKQGQQSSASAAAGGR